MEFTINSGAVEAERVLRAGGIGDVCGLVADVGGIVIASAYSMYVTAAADSEAQE